MNNNAFLNDAIQNIIKVKENAVVEYIKGKF